MAAWVAAAIFFGWQHYRMIIARGQADDVVERLVATTASMLIWALFTPLVFWLAAFVPLRKPHRARNTLLVLAAAAVVAAVRAVLDFALGFSAVDYRGTAPTLFHTHFLFALVVFGVANFLRLEREEQERRRAEACIEAEAAEARLRQLRSDLNPHFLFNTLNAVAELLHSDPRAAAEMLEKLRELLRSAVASEDAREVRLAEELEFISRYFDIQKMRFAGKLTTTIEVAGAHLHDAAVPPLLLQPLIENSIVHGISRRRDGGSVSVRIAEQRDGDGHWLCMQVRDDGPGCAPDAVFARGSIGVPNAVARLEAIYGRRQSLTYATRGDAFVAEVRIPLRMAS